jgi:hypothetical protein
VPFLLFGLVTFGQQAEETLITKPPNELKPFKFELEYTPLSDIQPVFLLKTKKNNYWGIKILSSSLFTLSNDKTIELFQINPITGFQTTVFAGINANPYIILNHIAENDILNLFYRKYFKENRHFVDVGYFYSYGTIAPFGIHHFGNEISYQINFSKHISAGSSIKLGPYYSYSNDYGLFYGGFGISLSYLLLTFNIY